MAGVKVVTRKLVLWHGREEEFSNVYYFGDGGAGLSPDAETTTSLINAVIAAEKLVTDSGVRFLGGAGYAIGIADTPGDTDAISTVELSATGNQGAIPGSAQTVNAEFAVDLKFLLGGRRYLRTLIHTCQSHNYDMIGKSAVQSAGLTASIKTFAEKMLNGPWVGAYQRIAPDGTRPTAIQYNPFMEHRQLHRYRRRNAGLLG